MSNGSIWNENVPGQPRPLDLRGEAPEDAGRDAVALAPSQCADQRDVLGTRPNAEALSAVRDFLRLQIKDRKTGDTTEVRREAKSFTALLAAADLHQPDHYEEERRARERAHVTPPQSMAPPRRSANSSRMSAFTPARPV